MGRRQMWAVWAAAAAVLLTAVVLYAVTADEREPTAVRMTDDSGRADFEVEHEDGSRAPESVEAIEVPQRPPVTLPDHVIEAVPELRIPEPRETTPTLPPSVKLPKAPPEAGRVRQDGPAFPDGSACGTPWGYGGYGAERAETKGDVTAVVGVYHCHSYDGEHVQNFGRFESANAVATDLVVDYGDGQKHDPPDGGWSCGSDMQGKPWHGGGPPHYYAAPGTYTLTVTITYLRCDGGVDAPAEPQTISVSIPVHQHAGKRPS